MADARGPALVLIPSALEARLLLGGAAPDAERPRRIRIAGRRLVVALAGIGLAAAGARAGRWLAELAPSAVALIGICGTLDPVRLPVGGLLVATSISCDGIGAGEGRRFVVFASPRLTSPLAPARTRRVRVFDGAVRGEVLSVAAAAAGRAMVAARRRRHPRALAEEMEGYSVAMAAADASVPLTILRGASNVAGDRDHRRWKFDEALAPCRRALEEWATREAP